MTPPQDTPAATTTNVLLIGNPNVGKSTLFNVLTSSRQTVTNAPGTTVDPQVGTWDAAKATVTDLPGTYSLLARTPDEQAVADALDHAPDAVGVVLLDATALSRSLYLLAQVAGTRPIVAVVTMLDVARAHGAGVDVARLADLLDVPVVALDPRSDTQVTTLVETLGSARPLAGAPEHGDTPLETAERVFAWVESIVLTLGPAPIPRHTRSDAIDRVLLHPALGTAAFLASMWAVFELTTTVASPVTALINGWVGATARAARETLRPAGPWVEGLLVDGVLVGVGTVLAFLPMLAIVYLALAVLEDSGYLARAGFLADRWMRTLGMDGRTLLPLVIGFGCNVPAVAATQTLPHARQRLLTGLLVPWTTCAARLPVYLLLAGAFFPNHAGTAVFAMYLLSIVLVAVGGVALRRTVFRDMQREPLLLVLPAYQRPVMGTILRSVLSRVRDFAFTTGRVIVATLTVVWLLMAVPVSGGQVAGPVESSLYGAAARAVAPAFAPAGFGDWHMSAALATGFVAKEVVVGSLAQSYTVGSGAPGTTSNELGAELRATLTRTSGGEPGAAALAVMVFTLGYTPCLATLTEQWRRFGRRPTLLGLVAQLAVAWLLAVVIFQLGSLIGRLT